MLPMPRHNGRAIAQSGSEAKLPLFSVTCRGKVTVMEARHDPRTSCNSVFRYPSPFGWSCSVPSGSPVFSTTLALLGKTGDIAGTIADQAGKRPAQNPTEGRGTDTCVSQQQFPLSHSLGFRLVAGPWASKRSSGQVRAPWPRQPLAAASRPAPLSAVQPTRSIVKNSPPAAERDCAPQGDLNCPAEIQPVPNPKPSTCESAAVAFLLPVSAKPVAGPDQEGR